MAGVSDGPGRARPEQGVIAPDAEAAARLSTPLPEGRPSARTIGPCQWLAARGLEAMDVPSLIEGLGQVLADEGFTISRLHVAGSTLHPEYVAFAATWRRDSRQTEARLFTDDTTDPGYATSPVAVVLGVAAQALRLRLDDAAVTERFPLLADYAGQGVTDYLIEKVGFGMGGPADDDTMIGCVCSWMTDRPGGFTDQDILDLRAIARSLALAVRARGDLETTHTLLEVYLGSDAGERVAMGQIRRGDVVSIRAAILYADLRGFSTVSTRLPTAELVELVNAYFGRIVGCLAEEGGEVLKFIGDGVLAIFPLDGDGREETGATAARALSAARKAIAAVEEVNAGREAAMTCPGLDIALHAGEVLYGNIGAPRRLDFTVVGSAVNAISRLEPLCQQFSTPIIVSEDFARHGNGALALDSLGHQNLRGLDTAMEVFVPVP